MNHDADYVIVFGGTNDFGHGDAPFGEIGDKTPDTFCGAVDDLVNVLLRYYKKEQIILERLWKYLACGMLLLKDCEAVLLPPAYLDLRSGAPAVEFRAALYKKRIMYSYRDADRKLRLTPDSLAERGMKYPEK